MTKIETILNTVKKTEYAVFDKQMSMLMIFDKRANREHGEERIKKIFKVEGDKATEFDLKAGIKELVDSISVKK